MSCDESFTAIESSELRYSVFGYLDASADTQWIRVMPVRTVVLTAPDSFGATVTIEDVATGRTITLRDSLFKFTKYNDSAIGSEGVCAHNFWTTERVQPGASYRLAVTRPGEKPAEAVVSIPRDYDVEVWISQEGKHDDLQLNGLKHVPFVVAINCGAAIIAQRDLFVVGSEMPWPPMPAPRPGAWTCARRTSSNHPLRRSACARVRASATRKSRMPARSSGSCSWWRKEPSAG